MLVSFCNESDLFNNSYIDEGGIFGRRVGILGFGVGDGMLVPTNENVGRAFISIVGETSI